MTHPHNANETTYADAVAVTRSLSAEAKRLDDICFKLCFDTIEATPAREEAAAIWRATQTLRDAVDAAWVAVRIATDHAKDREAAYARSQASL
jgi:hypothetical protein